ncbi:DUF6268 family outer membrane beta-barrel protein [Rasiella sp. SM2506]|uniref:DUF6268 family outer membrane beta-barrel protein n=1 Tax=Rasiella sp. SM2506 TaxID=3423914 RepID=UPI003D7AA07C
MNLKYKLSLVLLLATFIIPSITYAQLTDLARVEYTYFPQGDSENSFKRFRAFVNVPLKVSEDGYIVTGFEYRNFFLKLQDPEVLAAFDKTDLEHYQSFTFSLGYTDKFKDSDLRYALQGEVKAASNFRTSLESEDIIFGGSGYLIWDRTGDNEKNPPEKPWRLVLGLNYSTTAGRPFPLPFVNYYREFAPKWSFGLGVPKSNVKWEFVKDMELQGFVTLDGFFANIQEDITVTLPDGRQKIAENVGFTTVLSGIGYEWEFADHFLFYVYGGYTLVNDIRLRDTNDDDVFTINDTASYYTRGGIKVKI